MRAEMMVIVLLVFFLAVPLQADDAATSHPTPAEEKDDAPSMELIEFLGAWETDDGEWIDPVALEDPPLPDREMADE